MVSVGLVQGWQHAVSPDTYSGPQPKQMPRYPHRPGWLSDHLGLPSLRPRHGPVCLVVEGLQLHMTSLILMKVQSHDTDATIFKYKCHKQSQMIDDIIDPSCLSEKLTSDLEPNYLG